MVLGLLTALLTFQSVPAGFQPVEDTYIDAQLPDANFGRDGQLLGGPGTAILLRFPEMSWLPPGQDPNTAILTLHLVEPSEVSLKSTGRVLVPWSEGTDLRLQMARPPAPDPLYRGGVTWNRRRYGLTGPKWNAPGATSTEDATPVEGVTVVTEGSSVVIAGLGPAIAEMARDPLHNFGLRLEFDKKVSFYSSDGFGPAPTLAVTYKKDERHGAALAVLSLEPKGDPNKPSGWTAKVQNVGDGVATGMTATWRVRDEKKASTDTQQALAPGDTATIEWAGSASGEKGLPDVNPISVEVLPGGAGGIAIGQSHLSVPAFGLPVKYDLSPDSQAALDAARGSEPALSFLQRAVAFLNQGVLAQSRASFAPEGCYERVRLVTGDEAAVHVALDLKGVGADGMLAAIAGQTVKAMSPYRGAWTKPPDSAALVSDSIGWLPDTRDDSAWPFAIMLPNYPWGDPKPLQPPLPARGLLSRAELAAINLMVGTPVAKRSAFVPSLPNSAILSVADAAGVPIGGASIEVFPTVGGKLSTEAAYKGVTTSGGNMFLGPRDGKGPFGDLQADGSNSWLFVRVTREFVTETMWFPAWQLAVEKSRGNGGAPFVELRLMISSGAVKTDEDLATGKSVSDSLDRSPAELNAVVDGNPSTSLDVVPKEKPYWIEIDLARDRVIGAIEIETDGRPMEKFEIATYRTGQKPESAQTWIREGSGGLRLQERGKQVDGRNVVVYTSTALRSRYVRITYKAGPDVKVSAIRVRTLQQGS